MTTSKRVSSQTVPVVVFVTVFLIGALAGIYWGRWFLLLIISALSSVIPDAQTASYAQRMLFFSALWTYYAATILILPCCAAWGCSVRVRRLVICNLERN